MADYKMRMIGDMPHDIFISYSNRDKPVADAVCTVLEKKGIACWIAPRDIPPGANWVVELDSAIEECRMVLFLLSAQSNKSIHVQSELMLAAFTFHRDIVSLRIEDVEPSRQLRYPLSTHQRVNAFPPPLIDYLEKLATDLQLRLLKLKSNSPEVSIISPGVGEPWKPGVRHEIRWEVHTASDRTVQRLKLSLYQGSSEIRILADSASGFPAAASDFAWEVPSNMPPGEDYQLRLEIADDKGKPGSAQVVFSLQSPAATAAKNQNTLVESQEPSRDEMIPQAASEAAQTGSSPQPKVCKSSSREPTSGWSISELPFPFLPLGARLVCLCIILCFVAFGGLMGFASALHEGFADWKETSPPMLSAEDRAKRFRLQSEENSRNFGSNASERFLHPEKYPKQDISDWMWLQEHPEPEVPSFADYIARLESCLGRAASGFVTAGFWGLVIGATVGATVGSLWWITLAIAARVQQRPIEIVYDEWGSSFSAEKNQRRLEKIMGNESGTKTLGH